MSCLQCDKQPSATPSRSVTFGGPADTGVPEPLRFKPFWLKRREPRFAFAKFPTTCAHGGTSEGLALRKCRTTRGSQFPGCLPLCITCTLGGTSEGLARVQIRMYAVFGSPELFLRASVEEKKRKNKTRNIFWAYMIGDLAQLLQNM